MDKMAVRNLVFLVLCCKRKSNLCLDVFLIRNNHFDSMSMPALCAGVFPFSAMWGLTKL